MNVTKEVHELLMKASGSASSGGHEYVTPEHLLLAMAEEGRFKKAFEACGGDTKELEAALQTYLDENLDSEERNGEEKTQIPFSYSMRELLESAAERAASADKLAVELPHLVYAMMEQEDSWAAYLIHLQGIEGTSLLYELGSPGEKYEEKHEEKPHKSLLSQYALCLNEAVITSCPLIGREAELERTMQILCRGQKNNPLHIGEPGVGKTAITYGLAARINEGRVPDKLKGARVYSIDLGGLLAGTQYRGDFEKRLKGVMEELKKEKNPILYIDEIHNLVGAGAVNGSSSDASNLLKPYLTEGSIRFIGATTYEEYKKYFSRDKSLVRRFQNIEIREPSVEETVEILKGIRPFYEACHQVRYPSAVLEYGARLAARYINERFLPDKAIDLMDEAGAYLELHPKAKKVQIVDKKLMEQVISGICRIPKQSVETEDRQKLSRLEGSLKARVYGQDEAVSRLVQGIKLSQSGLGEEDKPVCSFLFVGPTGVGKTELSRAAAEILGIPLIRFDMSEYAEKHAVAKLIGAPAGYVGYEEGGLLTETVRKNPHCVLLLDEIEKAHPDIFNVLLQVMDYATLTDNQGRKADFRNVILLMTSNAGAEKADRSAIGFGGRSDNGDAVMDEVKRVFRPEFRNRLDGILIFRPLDQGMAEKIVRKEFKLLAQKAEAKKAVLTLSPDCLDYLCRQGLSREYGAREIKRVISREIKPVLADALLFGKLKKGGSCTVDYEDGRVVLK